MVIGGCSFNAVLGQTSWPSNESSDLEVRQPDGRPRTANNCTLIWNLGLPSVLRGTFHTWSIFWSKLGSTFLHLDLLSHVIFFIFNVSLPEFRYFPAQSLVTDKLHHYTVINIIMLKHIHALLYIPLANFWGLPFPAFPCINRPMSSVHRLR